MKANWLNAFMKRYRKTNGWDFLIKLTDKLDNSTEVIVLIVALAVVAVVAPITWGLPKCLPLLQAAAGKASDNLLLEYDENDEHRHD